MKFQNKAITGPKSTMRYHLRAERGFTLLELLMVLAISVVLAAIAIPEVMNSISEDRVRNAAQEFSSLVQQARITAQAKSVTLPLYTGTVQGTDGAFLACSSSSCPSGGNGTSYQSGDSWAIPYGGSVTNGTAADAPSGLSAGFTPESATTTMYLSPRGTVEKPNGTAYELADGFAFYFTDSRGDWAAVSVSSLGHTKVWAWNGSSWN